MDSNGHCPGVSIKIFLSGKEHFSTTSKGYIHAIPEQDVALLAEVTESAGDDRIGHLHRRTLEMPQRVQVSDAGLAHFKDCKGLASLDVKKTKVTASGIAEFSKALPQCKIEWDGGVIEPKK